MDKAKSGVGSRVREKPPLPSLQSTTQIEDHFCVGTASKTLQFIGLNKRLAISVILILPSLVTPFCQVASTALLGNIRNQNKRGSLTAAYLPS